MKWGYKTMNPHNQIDSSGEELKSVSGVLSEAASKLASSKGETMAESLCSILIIALATSMFLNFIVISGRIMDGAKEREKNMHEAVAFLEAMEGEAWDGEVWDQDIRDEDTWDRDIWDEEDWDEDTRNKDIIAESDIGELTVSIKSKSGKIISKEHFTVNVYYGPYGAAYR